MTAPTRNNLPATTARCKLTLLLSSEEIALKVASLGREISNDYEGRNPLLLGVLKGSFVFVADLVRQIDIDLSVDFIWAKSYSSSTSSGHVALTSVPHTSFRDRHVLLIEDGF